MPALVFSLNTYAAAALALFLSLRFNLAQPYWAMLTVYIVSQPLAGAVRSKALYRVAGTLLGGAGAIVVLPNFDNAPLLMALVIALWVGVCLYLSLLDRSPRSYIFMLAGYSMVIIGMPATGAPLTIFETAVSRVEEIGMGILCATTVHSLVLPRQVGAVLTAQLQRWLTDMQRWTLDILDRRDEQASAQDRQRLAADIGQLHALSTHLVFEASALRERRGAVDALLEQMVLHLPLLSDIADRLAVLDLEEVSRRRLDALLADIRAWIATPPPDSTDAAERLRAQLRALAPPAGRLSDWQSLLLASLIDQLDQVIASTRACRDLMAHIAAPDTAAPATIQPLIRQARRFPMHVDQPMVLRAALAASLATLLASLAWMLAGTAQGWGGVALAAIMTSLFAAYDDPLPMLHRFGLFTLISLPVAGFYLFAILPAINNFPLLMLSLAPVLVTAGVLMTHPRYGLSATAMALMVLNTIMLQSHFMVDAVGFLNGAIAVFIGLAVAVFATRLVRAVGAEAAVRRMLRQARREVARVAARPGGTPAPAFLGRMVDRLGLLATRRAQLGARADTDSADLLRSMRAGLGLLRLNEGLGRPASPWRQALAAVQTSLATAFGARTGPLALPPALLERLDIALGELLGNTDDDADTRAAGLASLVGLRRCLFPAAPPFVAPDGSGTTR